MLARGGVWLRLGVRPTAFGNALGNGLVDAMTTQNTAQESFRQSEIRQQNAEHEWRQSYFHRNGADIESDNAYQARRDREWIEQSDAIQRRRLGEAAGQRWADDVAARRAAGKQQQIDQLLASVGSGGVSTNSGAPAASRVSAQQAAAIERERLDRLQTGAWRGRTSQVTAALSPASSARPMVELDRSYYVRPGFITSSYQQGVAMMSNSQAPWYDRVIGGAAATLMSPMMLLEEGGRALLNVPFQARMAGQNAAQFQLATSTEERVVAGLNFLSNGSAAFVGTAPMIPTSVSLRPVLTAQEMAVAQFPGAEAIASARASYSTSSSPAQASFRNEALLAGHFEKHGGEFRSAGVSNADEYVQVGREIMDSGQEVKYFYERANEVRTGYVSFMRNSQKTGESLFGFVGTDTDGFITTIHKPRTELFDLLGDVQQSKLKAFRTDTIGPNAQKGWRWPYAD